MPIMSMTLCTGSIPRMRLKLTKVILNNSTIISDKSHDMVHQFNRSNQAGTSRLRQLQWVWWIEIGCEPSNVISNKFMAISSQSCQWRCNVFAKMLCLHKSSKFQEACEEDVSGDMWQRAKRQWTAIFISAVNECVAPVFCQSVSGLITDVELSTSIGRRQIWRSQKRMYIQTTTAQGVWKFPVFYSYFQWFHVCRHIFRVFCWSQIL